MNFSLPPEGALVKNPYSHTIEAKVLKQMRSVKSVHTLEIANMVMVLTGLIWPYPIKPSPDFFVLYWPYLYSMTMNV